MRDTPKIPSAEFSRRSILQNLAFTAGGAAMLGTTMSGDRVAAAQTQVTQRAVGDTATPRRDSGNRVAQTKVAQKAVHYQDTPKGAQRCDNCLQFEPPSSCKTVEGNIAPTGWCQIYVKKPA